ncbi:MAG: phospholipid carrier-dependent glycosyltransferase [Chloroflexi bacterium]|nr:phospholipid carrier-dependent glycosyltransferase [Chloroflexota bacterium]
MDRRRLPLRGSAWGAAVTLVLIWLFALVAAYFWAHKPFDVGSAVSLLRTTANLLVWLLIISLGAALGRRVIGALLDLFPAVMRVVLSTGVGLGLLSVLMLCLGLAGLYRPAVAWGLVLSMTVLLHRQIQATWRDVKAISLPCPNGRFRWLVLVYGTVSLLLVFAAALAPATAWDALVYHLVGPQLFTEVGRIVHAIDLPYLGFPQLVEMQFTLGGLLVGDGVAPLLHFGYGLMGLFTVVSLSRDEFGEDAAWMSAAVFLSAPTLLFLMSSAYVDMTLLFYVTATVYVWLRWWSDHDNDAVPLRDGRLWLAGLFCGFCGGVKYTAIAVPLGLGAALIWASRRDGLRLIVGRLLVVAIPAALVVLPGLLENWVTTGNPVYPFFSSQGEYWDAWRKWWYDRPGTGLLTTAPWRLLIAPVEASVLGTQGTVLYDASIGPLLVMTLPLLIIVWPVLSSRQRSAVGYLLVFWLVAYCFWLVGLARSALLLRVRHLSLAFGVVAVIDGLILVSLGALDRPRLQVSWLVKAAVGLTLVLLLVAHGRDFLRHNPVAVIVGVETPEDYLSRRLGWHYVATAELDDHVLADDVVLFLWEPRSFYCSRTCWPDALLDRWLHTTHVYGHDAGTIASAWRQQGATHVLLYVHGYEAVLTGQFDPITGADVTTLEDLRQNHLRLLHDWGGAYQLYRIEDG